MTKSCTQGGLTWRTAWTTWKKNMGTRTGSYISAHPHSASSEDKLKFCLPQEAFPDSTHPALSTRLPQYFTWTTVNLSPAGSRRSARGKGHEEGGLAYTKAGWSLRSSPANSRASTPPKPESAYFLLCAFTYTSDSTGGCPPLPLSEKRVSLQLQLLIPGCDSVSTYKLLWKSSSLPE